MKGFLVLYFVLTYGVYKTETKPQINKNTEKRLSCDKKCGTGDFHAAGICNFHSGRCLCEFGFTGPNSKFESENSNRITADHCSVSCDYGPDLRNPRCLISNTNTNEIFETATELPLKDISESKTENRKQSNSEITTTASTSTEVKRQANILKKCNRLCGSGEFSFAGACVLNTGRCLCAYGFTGPNSKFENENSNRILADHCTISCDYTHDFRNEKCVMSSNLKEEVEDEKEGEAEDQKVLETTLRPITQGGSEAAIVSDTTVTPTLKTTLKLENTQSASEAASVADTTAKPTSKAKKIMPVVIVKQDTSTCHEKCGSGQFHSAGTCDWQSGNCLCEFGYTGPNSRFESDDSNRILADHCTTPCHYSPDYRNIRCLMTDEASISTSKPITEKPVTVTTKITLDKNTIMTTEPVSEKRIAGTQNRERGTTTPKKTIKCNKKCGAGLFHSAGKCNQETGRCHCRFGFTGPNSNFESDNSNKIIADHCSIICSYTKHFRNVMCLRD